MDQSKIGRFIADRRKAQGMTQMQLAERLGITDRAVSKWETGRSMPDASVMLALCGILKITVNDLLCGEAVSMENYKDRTEENLLEMVRAKEAADRRLLSLEVVSGVVSVLFLFAMIAVGTVFMTMGQPQWMFFVPVAAGMIQFIAVALYALRIEQVAGYYVCAKCGHRYVPTYGSVSMAMHMSRTRYMKCPECGKWSWQKKSVSRE